MKIVYADFNARTKENTIRMNTVGSIRSLTEHCVQSGEWVWLSDGEIQVVAQIVGTIAYPIWETLKEV